MNNHTFTLKTAPNLCPLPCEEASLTLEVAGSPTLEELARHLLHAIGFDCDHAFGFHEDLNTPYSNNPDSNNYTAFAEDDPGVSDTRTTDVFTTGKTMLFHFDYGDDWHFHLTCDSVTDDKSAPKKGSRITNQTGKFPEQYPDAE